MILQALNDYYRRKQAADPEALAPEGFEFKEIPFVIVLNPDGSVHDIRDTRSGEGRARRAKRYVVPKSIERSGKKIVANLLWDNAEYALGLACEGRDTSRGDLDKRRCAFIERIEEDLSGCSDEGIEALRVFMRRMNHTSLAAFTAWRAIHAGNPRNPNLSFQLIGDEGLVAERQAVVEHLCRHEPDPDGDENLVRCLVTGEQDQLARLHEDIKGVANANTSGAKLVSFNKSSFNSYGKLKGGNSPVGRKAAANYAAALNSLLSQRVLLGDASTVFWASVPDTPVESAFTFLASHRNDDPDAGTHAVRGLFAAIRNGAYIREDGDERFHVLGLAAPSDARLSIRFWHAAPVREFAVHIAAWFEDARIALPAYEHREFLPLGELLRSLAVLGEAKNIPPNLAGDTLRAILEGRQLPAALLQQAVIRCRAERKVTPARASLIKACLTRQARLSHQPEHGITMSLDTQDTRPAYRLGRLFAALEKIQGDANPGLNATIRERYYGAASASPATVFPILMRLKNHHLAKLDGGMKIHRERLLGDIVDGIAHFPPQLSLPDQGLFAIGYYHQMQAFYTRKTSEPTDRTEENPA